MMFAITMLLRNLTSKSYPSTFQLCFHSGTTFVHYLVIIFCEVSFHNNSSHSISNNSNEYKMCYNYLLRISKWYNSRY